MKVNTRFISDKMGGDICPSCVSKANDEMHWSMYWSFGHCTVT